jgi:hypothetical protein
VATVAGSVISGALVVAFGWRIALLLPVPVAVVALLIAARAIRGRGGVGRSIISAASCRSSPWPHWCSVSGRLRPGRRAGGPARRGGGADRRFRGTPAARRGALYDLSIARRRLFWVPAVAGTSRSARSWGRCSWASSTCRTSSATTRCRRASRSSRRDRAARLRTAGAILVERGTRTAMIVGYVVLIAAFGTMLAWNETTPPVSSPRVRPGRRGASFVMTAASRSLTSSTPVRRAGMASATSDLQTDLGGAVMQALLGAVLAGGFSHVFAGLIAASPKPHRSPTTSPAPPGVVRVGRPRGRQQPAYAAQILEAARLSFVDGAWAAYLVGPSPRAGTDRGGRGLPGVAVEKELRGRYRDEDALTAP